MYASTKMLADLYISSLFTKARERNQPNCSSIDEWLMEMWYIYTMRFYLIAVRNSITKLAGKWMDLENIILSVVILDTER